MKIVKFSPLNGNNVGDNAISLCIEYIVESKGHKIDSYDIMFREVSGYRYSELNFSLRNKISYFLQIKFSSFFYFLKKILFLISDDKSKFLKSIVDVDHVMFGGGNLLMSKMGCDYNYRINKFLSYCPKELGKLIISCGVGPFEFEEEKLLRQTYSMSDKITVRDFNSASYFQNYKLRNVIVLPDPAFLISDISPQHQVNKNKLGVNVISNYFSDESLKVFASKLIQIADKEQLGVKILNSAYPTDCDVAEQLLILLSTLGFYDVEIVNLEPELDLISKSYENVKYFIGCRMHSIIFALSYSIPSIGFSWDEKVPSMFEQYFLEQFESIREYIVYEDPAEIDCGIFGFLGSKDFCSLSENIKKRINHGWDEIFDN